MDAWLLKELEDRRNNRQIAALSRESEISSPRLQKLAKGEAEPTAEELQTLTKLLRAAAPAVSPAPAKPVPTPVPVVVAPAKPAAPAAPAPVKPAVAPAKPVSAPTMAPPTAEFAQMKLPVQGELADFPYRQKLIEFARLVRDWPDKHKFPKAGELAYLQVLWNQTQSAIAAVNVRIWGKPEGPGVALEPKGRRRKPHHSLRFLFKQAAEERLPREAIEELTKVAREAIAQGAAAGFLDAFVKAANTILDEEDFESLVEAAAAAAGPGAQVESLYGESETDEAEGAADAGGATEGTAGETPAAPKTEPPPQG